jgi:hypothetical protein
MISLMGEQGFKKCSCRGKCETTGFTLILYFWKKMLKVVMQDEKFVECSCHRATTWTPV